jgi:serine phosphatase RsbU (regulator of sigma subunit)/CHASE3 domain sensor protein
MKRARTIHIGQIVGVGLGLILFLVLVVGLAGRLAYDVSKGQNAIIQTRGEVESLALELQILATRRTDAMRRYLDTQSATYLVLYRDAEVDYDQIFTELTPLLRTPQEIESWQAVVLAEAALDDKAQEVFRLYDTGFPDSARFLWDSEGLQAQENLLTAITDLRQTQRNTSVQVIEQAMQTENLAVTVVSLFFVLALIGGIAASLIITRIITKPLSHLVTTTSAIGSDLTQRVEPSGPEEIAFLGQTINEMAANLAVSRQALQAHNERLEHELSLASQIQASFFPETLPQFPGLELAAYWQPAREMGGDFYTTLDLGDGRLILVVADVSGKGAPAAMAGALAVGLLEAYAPGQPEPETLLAKLNQDLHARFIANYINVACCYAILDLATLGLTVANAGCVYPYLRRGDKLCEIDVFGLPLGMWPDYSYLSQSLTLQPGDLLLLSSDGLIEARNEKGEIFGFERLETELRRLPAQISAQAAVDQLVAAVMTFTGQAELADDLTVLVVRATTP